MNRQLYYLIQFKESVKRKGFYKTFKNTALVFLHPIYRKVWAEPILKSYSLLKDDLIIEEKVGKGKVFYVDIGACSPDYISNTKRFYLRGSTGINIEPNPELIKVFNEKRKRDINLQVAISDKAGMMKLSVFDYAGHGTLSDEQAKEWKSQGKKITKEIEVKVLTLREVLEKHCHCPIDFMNIDADGSEMQILRSNDWERFRPKVIILETPTNEMEYFLSTHGYEFYKENRWCDVPVNRFYYDRQ